MGDWGVDAVNLYLNIHCDRGPLPHIFSCEGLNLLETFWYVLCYSISLFHILAQSPSYRECVIQRDRTEAFTVVLLRSGVFWNMVLCQWAKTYSTFGRLGTVYQMANCLILEDKNYLSATFSDAVQGHYYIINHLLVCVIQICI